MFEKPKKSEDESGPKKIEETGAGFLSGEFDRLPDSPKTGGFLLTTFLAMGLALAGAGGTEAQVRTNRFPIGGPTSGAVGGIFQQGRMGASQVMERKKMEARVKIDREYQKKFQEIGAKKNQLEQEFKNESISVGEFEARMAQLDNEMQGLSQERDVKMMNPLGIKGAILEGIVRGY